MPTNEERREVAEELRYTASHSLNGYGFQRAVEGIVFGTLGDRTWRKILERLADLIEPEPERTCKMMEEHDWNDEWKPYGIWCSECDEAVYGWKSDYAYPIPKYCPNCGAKVVE